MADHQPLTNKGKDQTKSQSSFSEATFYSQEESRLQSGRGENQILNSSQTFLQSFASRTLANIGQAETIPNLRLASDLSNFQGQQSLLRVFGGHNAFLARQLALASHPIFPSQLQLGVQNAPRNTHTGGTGMIYNSRLDLGFPPHISSSMQPSVDLLRLQSLKTWNKQRLFQSRFPLGAFYSQPRQMLPQDSRSSSQIALSPNPDDGTKLPTKRKSEIAGKAATKPKSSLFKKRGQTNDEGIQRTDRRYNYPPASNSLIALTRQERLDQHLSGQQAVPMYLEIDEENLSDYQCFLRQQIELFEANDDDIQWNAQKMNKPVVLGQVGIRCRYCSIHPPWTRQRGAVYYSATTDGLYQAGQNMSKNHFAFHCTAIPENAKQKLRSLKDGKRRANGGKNYWASTARALGVYEDRYGLRFRGKVQNPTK